MKKTALMLFLALLVLSLCAVAEAPPEETKLEGPYLVTTCGQSPGAVMVGMSAMQAGAKATYNNALTAETFEPGEFKTLIVTAGTSMKGMGAAGTDINAEIERCLGVIKAAREAGLKIVGAHIEGMARRTDSSDAASIEAVMAEADVILVVADSDSDGFFTAYAKEHEKPLIVVKDALEIGKVL